jgi:hypothetical protein
MAFFNAEVAKCAPQLIGKRIAHIVLKAGTSPKSQLFLVFDDGTYYEFFGGPIYGASAVDQGSIENVRRYLTPPQEIVVDV